MTLTCARSQISQRNCKNTSNKHLDTPQKARIRQSYNNHKIAFLNRAPGHQSIQTKYKQLGVSKATYYCHIQSQATQSSDRTLYNQPNVDEPRGWPRKITPVEIDCME